MKKAIIDSTALTYIIIAIAIVMTGLTFVLFLPASPDLWSYLFNADALFLPALWRHLFEDQGSWATWYPSVVGFYAPDMVIFFASQIFTDRPDYAVYLFFIAQLILIGFSFALLLRKPQTDVASNAVTALAPAFLTILIFIHVVAIVFVGGQLANTTLIVGPLITPAHHTGTIITTLLGFFLALRIEREPRAIWLVTWVSLGVLAVASDKLYIPSALGPILVYGILKVIRKQITYTAMLRAIFLSGLVIVLGHQLWILIGWWHRPAGVDGKIALPSEMLISISQIIRDSQILLTPEWLCISIPMAIGFILLSLDLWRWMRNKNPSHDLNVAVLVYLGAILPLIATIMKGFYSGPTTFRYIESIVMFPIFWTWYRYTNRLTPFIISRYLLPSVVLASTLCVLLVGARNWREFSGGYYPPLVACLDKMSGSAAGFPRNGFADYWNTKPIRIFTRNNLKVAQLNASAKDEHWISSDTWTKEVNIAAKSGETIFIVTTRLDDLALKRQFGPPRKELICAGERVNIYPPGTK